MNAKDELLQYIEKEYEGKFGQALLILERHNPYKQKYDSRGRPEDTEIVHTRFYMEVQTLLTRKAEGRKRRLNIREAIQQVITDGNIPINELIPTKSSPFDDDDGGIERLTRKFERLQEKWEESRKMQDKIHEEQSHLVHRK